ncbi:MAG: FecR domain-containing protein [Desulfobacteraceae bacterium]|nr:FecR domain-containing protein [Desulfobacteraceae bacterium]
MSTLKIFIPQFFLIVLFFCTCIICISEVVTAKDLQHAGFVIALRGKVQAVDTDGNTRMLAIKDYIYVEDTIKTGKRSRLQLMFQDNTIISLGSDSELKIAEYNWNSKTSDGKIVTEVKEGAFRIMGGLISKEAPDKFKTKTPAAVIGIRGSMYAGSVRDGKLSVVFEGGRGISLKNATGQILITKPGYGSYVKGWGKAIKASKKFTPRDFIKVPTHLNRRRMLKKVLKARKNLTRAEFDAIINDATRNDLSLKEAKKVVEELKKDPDFSCK